MADEKPVKPGSEEIFRKAVEALNSLTAGSAIDAVESSKWSRQIADRAVEEACLSGDVVDAHEAARDIESLEEEIADLKQSMGDIGDIPDEILDLIAEAARTSPHAKRAYELLDRSTDTMPLANRQRMIEGRMGGLFS